MGEMSKKSKKSKKGRERKPSAVSGRKPSRDKRLNATVQGAKAYYLWYEKQLKNIEAAAGVIPVETADELVQFASRQRRVYARYIRLRFGAKVQPTQGDAPAFVTKISGDKVRLVERGGYKPVADLSVVRPERLPRSSGEEELLHILIWKYEIVDLAHQAMIEVGWEVKEAGLGVLAMARVMCQVFLKIHRLHFVFSGISIEQRSELQPALREMHTALLAGWVNSKISLKRNRRLSAALAEGGGNPSNALLRELPAATLIGWNDAGSGGSVKGLRYATQRCTLPHRRR